MRTIVNNWDTTSSKCLGQIGGIEYGPSMTDGGAFLLELSGSFWMLVIAYGIAFDPS